MAEKLKIRLQGISRDLTQANGDFDTIDHGHMSPEELINLFQKAQTLKPPANWAEADLCPPQVIVEGPIGQLIFTLDGGKIYNTESEEEVTPFDAVSLAAGRKDEEKKAQTKIKTSKGSKYPEGMTPLGHLDLPPTNINKIGPNDINTGSSSPQITHLVWKDGAWQGGFWFLLLFAALGLIFTIVGFQKPVEVLAVAGGGAGLVIFLFLAILVARHGKEHIRVGLDWDTNTLWAVRGGRTHYLPNANCIRSLQVQKESQGRGPGAAAIGDDVIPTGGGGNVTYCLVTEYSSGEQEFCPGTEFQKKKEATGILKKTKALL